MVEGYVSARPPRSPLVGCKPTTRSSTRSARSNVRSTGRRRKTRTDRVRRYRVALAPGWWKISAASRTALQHPRGRRTFDQWLRGVVVASRILPTIMEPSSLLWGGRARGRTAIRDVGFRGRRARRNDPKPSPRTLVDARVSGLTTKHAPEERQRLRSVHPETIAFEATM